MFSFGTIKTATALGGGIIVIRNNAELAVRIDALHTSYSVQKRSAYFRKLTKYLFLKLLFPPAIFYCFVSLSKIAGIDYDSIIQNLSKSFPGGDFFIKIRIQPSYPLLKLMLRRFKNFSDLSIQERIYRGRYLLNNLSDVCRIPGIELEKHTFWVFPILHDHPVNLIQNLRKAGFDATQKHGMEVMKTGDCCPDNKVADCNHIVRHIVYLPFYNQIPMAEIDRMISLIKTDRP
jgi:dTDP-4-amino-4,6-dideoxygalactose transaminase